MTNKCSNLIPRFALSDQRYFHFMPKDKRDTANSIPFDF